MALHLADLLAEHWENYANAHRHQLTNDHYRAVRRVLACRTAALGGRLYQCAGCKEKQYAYHSCNHRSCPQCGALDPQIWSAKQETRLLPVPYFMVTFTLPAELRPLCLLHPEILYPTLLKQSAAALQDICAPKLPEPIPFTCQCCGGVLTFLREIAPIRLLRAPPTKTPRP